MGFTKYVNRTVPLPIKGFAYVIKKVAQMHHLEQFNVQIAKYFEDCHRPDLMKLVVLVFYSNKRTMTESCL